MAGPLGKFDTAGEHGGDRMREAREIHSQLKHSILEKVQDLVFVSDQPGRCAVALPVPDNLGENVELYVQTEAREGKFLLHDDAGTLLRFREGGYDWGEAPNDERFASLLDQYGVKVDSQHRVFLEAAEQDLPDAVWRFGGFLGEASQLLNLARPTFRYNFRRALREYMLTEGIPHRLGPSFDTEQRTLRFDFSVGTTEGVLLDALTATSVSQADALIAKVFMDATMLRRVRQSEKMLIEKRLAVAYDAESEIPESARFAELQEILDLGPVSSEEFPKAVREWAKVSVD